MLKKEKGSELTIDTSPAAAQLGLAVSKASCIAGSVNNVGQDEILHIGIGWLHPLDSDGP